MNSESEGNVTPRTVFHAVSVALISSHIAFHRKTKLNSHYFQLINYFFFLIFCFNLLHIRTVKNLVSRISVVG
jgi:hypothetical protein